MRYVLLALALILARPAGALDPALRPLDVRSTLRLIDSFPGETRLEKVSGMFSGGTAGNCAPPTPEELEGYWAGIRINASGLTAGPELMLVARDPERHHEELPCDGGCGYDELTSWRQHNTSAVPTPDEFRNLYLYWWSAWRNQTMPGFHTDGMSQYWLNCGGPGPEDKTTATPGAYLRWGICDKLRRCGPLLIAAHVNEEKFQWYEVFYRRYDGPELPGPRGLHFRGKWW